MGIIHYAYAFDPVLFRSTLAECLSPLGKVKPDLLKMRAMEALQDCSLLGKEFLEDIRFDAEEWLDATTESAIRQERLLMICLAQQVSGIRKLSQPSFAMLQLLLPMVGWSEENVRLLLLGRQLRRLFESLKVAYPVNSIQQVSKSPSWLAALERSSLMTNLNRLRERFCNPSEDLLKAVEQANSRLCLGGKSPLDLSKTAFREMEERLVLRDEDKCDLILVNEISTYTGDSLYPL